MSGHGRDRPGEAKLSTLQRADSPSELYKSRGNDVKLGYMRLLRLMGDYGFSGQDVFERPPMPGSHAGGTKKCGDSSPLSFSDDLALETKFVCAADFT